MSYEFDQIAEMLRDEAREIARDEIIQAKDNGEIVTPDRVLDEVRDTISNMDQSEFVDTDTVAEEVVDHWRFTDAVATEINSVLEYEGLDTVPGQVEDHEDRLNALEGAATDPDNEGYNALVNTVTNLTERIVYMEGVINALVDAALLVTRRTEHTTVPDGNFRKDYAQSDTDDAPYAAI